MTGLYQRDLAYIHHVGFGGFARAAAPGVLALLRDAIASGSRVVELGCGSGILAGELLDEGYSVLGVDISPAMLELARGSAPGAEFVESSLHEFEIPGCAAVVSIGESIGYIGGGKESLDVRPLLGRVASALPTGGLFVFDVLVKSADEGQSYRSWTAGEGWAVLVEVSEEPGEGRLRREIVTFRETGRGCFRRDVETHLARIFQVEEMVGWLEAEGFEVAVGDRYGDHALAPGRCAFVARKR